MLKPSYFVTSLKPSFMEVMMTSTVANWLSTPSITTRLKKTTDQTCSRTWISGNQYYPVT